jgi:hypothetical protein
LRLDFGTGRRRIPHRSSELAARLANRQQVEPLLISHSERLGYVLACRVDAPRRLRNGVDEEVICASEKAREMRHEGDDIARRGSVSDENEQPPV